jgi:anti-sigma-K factor RskA
VEEKDFIESGILELYVLDALSLQERSEVESMCSGSALVSAELKRIEASMEVFALEFKIEPSSILKSTIESYLDFNSSVSDSSIIDIKKTFNNEISENGNSFKSLVEKRAIYKGSIKSNIPKYAFAASIALFLISLIGSYSLWNKLKDSQNKYADLLNKNALNANQVSYFKNQFYRSKKLIDDPDFKKLALIGTKTHLKSLAVVWWNKKSHTVMIDPNGLVATDQNHSYQLWAISNGKPVDAGVFEVKSDLSSLSKLNDISDAQAFAITLEPKGGSKNPTMSEMYVMSAI